MHGFGIGELILVFVAIPAFAFWVWMLVDCLKNESGRGLLWMLVLLFAQLLGAIIYWGMRYRPRRRTPPASLA